MSRPVSGRQIQPPGGSRGSRRGGAGGSHQDMTTPEPIWSDKLAFKVSSLSFCMLCRLYMKLMTFQKGDVVRVKPNCGMLPEFPEGQVVIITAYESAKTSPTVVSI